MARPPLDVQGPQHPVGRAVSLRWRTGGTQKCHPADAAFDATLKAQRDGILRRQRYRSINGSGYVYKRVFANGTFTQAV